MEKVWSAILLAVACTSCATAIDSEKSSSCAMPSMVIATEPTPAPDPNQSYPYGVGYTGTGINPQLHDHVAYLTFDDGPSDWTEDFLDILKSKGVKATFFVTTNNINKSSCGLGTQYLSNKGVESTYEDVLIRELNEGHVIGNHTMTHPDLGQIEGDKIEQELSGNEQIIASVLKAHNLPPLSTALVRPPYGNPWFNNDESSALPTVGTVVSQHGVNIMWTLDSTDSWEFAQGESYSRTVKDCCAKSDVNYDDKVARIKKTVLDAATGPGMIIIMHDIHPTTKDALSDIIDGLLAQGYSFQTIEDYVVGHWGKGSYQLIHGNN